MAIAAPTLLLSWITFLFRISGPPAVWKISPPTLTLLFVTLAGSAWRQARLDRLPHQSPLPHLPHQLTHPVRTIGTRTGVRERGEEADATGQGSGGIVQRHAKLVLESICYLPVDDMDITHTDILHEQMDRLEH